jgi:hypothetical protein
MTRRRRSVVLILSTDDFDRLEQSARAHGHDDPYLHAHWVLAERLGLSLPIVPSQGAVGEPHRDATKSAARG